MRLRGVLLVALFLSGCASVPLPVEQIVEQAPVVPASDLECAGEPEPRGLKTESQLKAHIVDLREAGQDCRDKLGVVKQIVGTP